MMVKTSQVRIFTFTGHPEDLSDALIKRLESDGNRVIDIISATESMTQFNLDPGLHYTMLYRLT